MQRSTTRSLTLLALASPALAGDPALTLHGPTADAAFGSAVERIGDVDGDGTRDFAVGAPGADVTFFLPFPVLIEEAGIVSVHSGTTGDLLWDTAGPLSGGTEFGTAISDAGDVDGDGYDDVLVGAPAGDGLVAGSGIVQLFCGQSGAWMATYEGGQASERFGAELCVGEMNGSPGLEVAIGAPWHDLDDNTGGFLQEGRVQIIELATGLSLKNLPGEPYTVGLIAPDDILRRHWGEQMAFLGDDDLDGFGTLVIAAPYTARVDNSTSAPPVFVANIGLLRVFEPLDPPAGGLFDNSWRYGDAGELLGFGLEAFEADLNGDGSTDWGVYAPGTSDLEVWSGSDTLLLQPGTACVSGLTAMSDAGDHNGDGVGDVLIGVANSGLGFGHVCVLSGASGFILTTIEGPVQHDRFGSAVASADMSGDGAPELWVGARADDTFAQDAGAVYVLSQGTCPNFASWQIYGVGTPGSNGIPTLTSSSTPALGSLFTIDVASAATTDTPAGILIGLQSIEVTLLGAVGLVLPFQVLPFNLPPTGASLPFAIPSDESFCGLDVFLQVLVFDTGAPEDWAFSPGMQLTLGS